MTNSARIAGAWFGTFTTSGGVLLCGMLTGILVARFLGPEGRGALAAIQFWPGLTWSIVMLSFQAAVTYRIARAEVSSKATVSTALILALLLGLATGGLTALMLPYVLGEERREWWSLAQTVALIFIPLKCLGVTLLAVDQGTLRFARYNLRRLAAPVAYLVGLLGLWATGSISLATVVWVHLLSTGVVAAAHLAFSARAVSARPSWKEVKKLVTMHGRFHTTGLAFLLGSQIDRLTVVLLWPDAGIGLYIVALRWASVILEPVTASFRNVLFPHISVRTDPEKQRALLATGLRYASLLLVLGSAALALVTPWCLPLLFGDDFGGAVPIALALLAAYLPLTFRQIIIHGLRGLDLTRPGTIAESVTIVAFAVAVWPLAQVLDLLGIAFALAIANTLSIFYLLFYLERNLDIGPSDWWGGNLTTARVAYRTGLNLVRTLPGAEANRREKSPKIG